MNPVRAIMFYYIYVLQSKKDKHCYTGFTVDPVRGKSPLATADMPLANRTSNGMDLRKRLKEHNEGGYVSWTKGRGPFDLIYYEACKNKEDTRQREKYLKTGMGKRYLKNRLRRFLALTG